MTERQAFRLALVMIIIALAMIIAAPFVHADSGSPSTFWRPDHGWQRQHVAHRPQQRRVTRASQRRNTHKPAHKATKVKAWRVVVPPLPAGCIATIDVVGDRRPGTEAAKEQALQSLRQEAAFRYGEVYADAANLQQVAYQCVTTTINNSFTGAIDKARQFVGGEEGLLHRCRISAAVCRAPMEAAE